MTVRVYRWDDAGAPTLNATAGSLINLFDACLVTGYGSKDPLGWSKPFTGTDVAVFRPAAGNRRYLRVTDSSTATSGARAFGCETMTDASTYTNAFPSEAQVSGGLYIRKSDTTTTQARGWVIIGNDKCFYYFVNRTSTTGFAATAASGGVFGMFFGDFISYRPDDEYNTAFIASESSTVTVGRLPNLSASPMTNAIPGAYVCRRNDQTGVSTAATMSSDARSDPVSCGRGNLAYPDPVTGGMVLAPVYINTIESSHTRGHLPGMWNPLHDRPGAVLDTFTGKSGSPLAGKEFALLHVDGTTTSAGTSARTARVAMEISNTWS
jgi:hypothetical protein